MIREKIIDNISDIIIDSIDIPIRSLRDVATGIDLVSVSVANIEIEDDLLSNDLIVSLRIDNNLTEFEYLVASENITGLQVQAIPAESALGSDSVNVITMVDYHYNDYDYRDYG